MKFNINDYKGKYVMHCKTEEEALGFYNYLDSIGKTWISGIKYTIPREHWLVLKENYCHNFNVGTCDSIEHYIKQGYTILEWEDFMKKKEFTKADLKSGDIVIFRNHEAGVVFLEQNAIIFKGFDEYLDLSAYDTKLCDDCSKDWDIVKVHRPDDYYGLMHKQWYKAPVVWEREETVEMTLAEVCKALGKNVKIVKE